MKRTLIASAGLAAIAILAASPASSSTIPKTAFQEPATVQSSYDVGAGGTLRIEASFEELRAASAGGATEVGAGWTKS